MERNAWPGLHSSSFWLHHLLRLPWDISTLPPLSFQVLERALCFHTLPPRPHLLRATLPPAPANSHVPSSSSKLPLMLTTPKCPVGAFTAHATLLWPLFGLPVRAFVWAGHLWRARPTSQSVYTQNRLRSTDSALGGTTRAQGG